MNTRKVSVLFEDMQGLPDEFGPSRLLKAVVQDRRGLVGPPFAIHREIHEIATNGNGQMWKRIQRLEITHPLGEPVIAVFDYDRIRKLVPAAKCKSEIISELRGKCDDPERLKIVLLEMNTESLLEVIKYCDSAFVSDVDFDAAIEMKRINARDIICRRAASPEQRKLRDCVLKRVPSFERLRDYVIAALDKSDAPPATV